MGLAGSGRGVWWGPGVGHGVWQGWGMGSGRSSVCWGLMGPGRKVWRGTVVGRGVWQGRGPVLTRLWFSCSSWRKDGSAGPRGIPWSWGGSALGEAEAPVPGIRGGHGQGRGPELGPATCREALCSCSWLECRAQPHPSLVSICPCLILAGSCGLCRCSSPSSLVMKFPGTSPPTLGPPPPVPRAEKGLAVSIKWVGLRGAMQGHLVNPGQGGSRHPPWLPGAGGWGHWGWVWPQGPRVFGPSIPPCDPFLTPGPGFGLACPTTLLLRELWVSWLRGTSGATVTKAWAGPGRS